MKATRVFISYSWDDLDHREWVRDFATRLRAEGIDAILDRWEAVPGDQLPAFMERAVRESDYVLCICTSRYREKSDVRDGGVGYEGDIMTSEVFVTQNQRKFIPILRRDEWKSAAPTWLSGKYYIDLRGDPYREETYQDLYTTLCGVREDAPPIGKRNIEPVMDDDHEFVNRKIELATLDPARLQDRYCWQCALVNSPTGYGKSRLLKRLLSKIQSDEKLRETWNCRYIDLQGCESPERVIAYIAEKIIDEQFTSEIDEEKIKDNLCNFILDKMSMPTRNGASRCVLLVFDSIDNVPPGAMEWLFSLIHDVIVGSHMDYEKGELAFPLRIIVAGRDTSHFWDEYVGWEDAVDHKYKLKVPEKLNLSAFDDAAVQELISRRAGKSGIDVRQSIIPNISNELLYLSGGHPAVINGILDELIAKKFRQFQDYIRLNRERLIKNHLSAIARKVLDHYPLSQAKRDIRTICILRIIDLNILRELCAESLISRQLDPNTILRSLLNDKILNPPGEKPFYHDDIIRRVLYLDAAFSDQTEKEHVHETHMCAKRIYSKWIGTNQDEHILNYFFIEWLFHVLQLNNVSNAEIVDEWKRMLSQTQLRSILPDHFRQTIKKKLDNDREVKYLYRERFGSEDLSRLFE